MEVMKEKKIVDERKESIKRAKKIVDERKKKHKKSVCIRKKKERI